MVSIVSKIVVALVNRELMTSQLTGLESGGVTYHNIQQRVHGPSIKINLEIRKPSLP